MDALPKVTDQVPLKIALRELYETRFGIYNHIGSSNNVFASVSFHESENFMHDTRFKNIVLRYYQSGVKDITGMNLPEFLNETSDTIENLLTICEEITTTKNKAQANMAQELGIPTK